MHPNEDLFCEKCPGRVFESRMFKIIHLNQKHPVYSPEGLPICSECGDLFTSKKVDNHDSVGVDYIRRTIENHIRKHFPSVKSFKCKDCPEEFQFGHQLHKHKQKFHETRTEFKCQKCNVEFKTREELKKHYSTEHQKGSYICSHCGKVFKQKVLLQTHMKRNHENHERSFFCEECGKNFRFEIDMQNHFKRMHTDEFKMIPCSYEDCDKILKGESALRKHIKTVHEKILPERKLSCSFCPKVFIAPGHLKRHVNSIHLNKRELKCDKCDFGTNYKSALTEHINAMHLGIMHDCHLCTKSYNKKHNLYAHQKTSHGIPRPTRSKD